MPAKEERCIEKVMQDQGKTRSEATAICKSAMQKAKSKPKDTSEMESKNTDITAIAPVPVIRPTLAMPKHDQSYCGFLESSPFEGKKCTNCAFYIKGDGMADNQCQLTQANPLRILPDSYCRFWQSLFTLEGFVPVKINIDDSLPDDIKALIQDNDVEDE